MKIEIGYKIKQIRKSLNGGRGLSMEEFGKLFEPPASKGVVSNWENNYNYPNEKRLNRIAKLGDMSVEKLLYGSIEDDILSEVNLYINSLESIELTDEARRDVIKNAVQQSIRKPWINKTYRDEDQHLFKSYIHDEVDSAISRLFNRTDYTNKGFIRFTTIGLNNLKDKLKDYSLNGIDNDLYNDTTNIIENAKNSIFDLQDKHEID